MSLYEVNGDNLITIYDINASVLNAAYDVDGIAIPLYSFDDSTTVTNIYTSSISAQPQGGCMDDEGNLITIFPSSGKFVKHNITSGVDTEYSFTPDVYGHGNGMAYNPSTECFYVAAMKNTGEVYVFDKSFNLVDTLYVRNENDTIFNCWDIAYDQKHQRFITNTGTKLYFMDDDFEYISHVNTPASAWPATAQDIETDGDFVYFINYNPNSISVLDMKGNFIKSISNTGFSGEPESMCYDWENNAYYIEGKSSYYVIRQVVFK